MTRANKFVLPPTWRLMLKDMGVNIQSVTSYARLPSDIFVRQNVSLSPDEYFRLWHGIGLAGKDKDIPLLLAENMTAESFDAPIFASLCSENFNAAVKRLSYYKPLIGPLELKVHQDKQRTKLTISCYGNKAPIPRLLGLCEAVFFTQLARLATREKIKPTEIVLQNLPSEPLRYEFYFGCKLRKGEELSISFSSEDAKMPFLTSNLAMWEFFEGRLNQQLSNLSVSASMTERVRAVLIEAIPSGEGTIENVASKLAMSKRTLQRKLTLENESFQTILQTVRSELADYYLEKSNIPLCEISFLLGFGEANSFIRAYSRWKGVSPGQYREQFH